MYGTKDAAQNWEREYMAFLRDAKLKEGRASPCMFYNEERNLRVVIHGDDITILGKEGDLDLLREQIAKRFDVKVRGRLGPDPKR